MVKIPDRILGILPGKLVPVKGYWRIGENIFRSASKSWNEKIIPKKSAQRDKMKICNDFIRAFPDTGFFNKTFPSYGETGTGYNRAANTIMNLAISGSFPNTGIFYPNVLISKGLLPGAENAAASDDEEGNILFSWMDNTGNGTAKANDKVILIAYFPAVKQVIYSIDAATRADCKALLETNTMQGYNAETWIGFVSPDEKDAANSRYTGTIYL